MALSGLRLHPLSQFSLPYSKIQYFGNSANWHGVLPSGFALLKSEFPEGQSAFFGNLVLSDFMSAFRSKCVQHGVSAPPSPPAVRGVFGVPGDGPDGPISASPGPAISRVQMAHWKIIDGSAPCSARRSDDCQPMESKANRLTRAREGIY